MSLFRFNWTHPYGWRTNLRSVLPGPVCWWIGKGRNCESVGAAHHWYNEDEDNEHSACYYCRIVRPGKLWHHNSGASGV